MQNQKIMPRNSYFQFKQFRIIQEKSAMKVGVDGVLLGAWTTTSGAKRILDIGTGTGLIALMMAQKNSDAWIDAIEIDPDAWNEASLNIGNSSWAGRIGLKLISFQEFCGQKDQKYDLIISNPPFFTNGIKAPEKNRSQARHADSLPLNELIRGAAGILEEGGRIALILPVDSLQEINRLASENNLWISRLCRVKPNPEKAEFRIMVELTNIRAEIQEDNLMIEYENHHDYTPEYKTLTSDFYLKF